MGWAGDALAGAAASSLTRILGRDTLSAGSFVVNRLTGLGFIAYL